MEFLVLLTIIAVLVFYSIFRANDRRDDQKELEKLKTEYDLALKSGDKQNALIAGRNYYSKLRKGKLTLYDEQAISNDLAAMK